MSIHLIQHVLYTKAKTVPFLDHITSNHFPQLSQLEKLSGERDRLKTHVSELQSEMLGLKSNIRLVISERDNVDALYLQVLDYLKLYLPAFSCIISLDLVPIPAYSCIVCSSYMVRLVEFENKYFIFLFRYYFCKYSIQMI